jgi:hypothetical protein
MVCVLTPSPVFCLKKIAKKIPISKRLAGMAMGFFGRPAVICG